MITRITIEPWARSLFVVVGDTDEEVKAFFKGHEDYRECFTFDPLNEAETICTPRGHAVIRFTTAHQISDELIVHECLHATYGMLKHVGIPLTEDTEEVYAYQIDYIFKHVKALVKS